MAKTINIVDNPLKEINILPDEQKANVSYSLLDDKDKEYDTKRVTIEKAEFTKTELSDIIKVINIFHKKIKAKENI